MWRLRGQCARRRSLPLLLSQRCRPQPVAARQGDRSGPWVVAEGCLGGNRGARCALRGRVVSSWADGRRPLTVAILALGGEGGGVLSDWIVAAAEGAGYYAQNTSVAGVAQRTGA